MATPGRDNADLTTELNDLLYAIGHDLRAPVRAITGFTNLLKEQLATPSGSLSHTDSRRFLGNIDTAAKRLQQMIDGLLALSGLSQHTLQRQTVALRPLSESVVAKLAPHSATIVVDIPAEATLLADPVLLRVTLTELLDNAVKFSRDTTEAMVRISTQRENDTQVLCVSDNGLGFDMQYASRLGMPFQTLHARPDLNGVGLGLAKVRCATRLHGGVWSAESHPGQGSRFFVRWP